MRWPRRIPAGTICDHIAGNIDLLPTFARLVGVPLPTDRVIDGLDITPLMFDPTSGPVRTTHLYFSGVGTLVAIRDGDWKLFLEVPLDSRRKSQGKLINNKKTGRNEATYKLYDLALDVGEAKNVASANPEVVARLHKLAVSCEAEIRANQRPAGRLSSPNQ